MSGPPNPRNRPPATLAPPARFAANERLRPPPAAPNADQLMDAMVRRHCAGLHGRLDGAQTLAALISPPNMQSPAADTIRWLLGSTRIRDLHQLAWKCAVPIPLLAAHVRAHGMTHQPLIRWLNQFAAPLDPLP